jgi:uncharacterized membrane protein (UPF0127 family)
VSGVAARRLVSPADRCGKYNVARRDRESVTERERRGSSDDGDHESDAETTPASAGPTDRAVTRRTLLVGALWGTAGCVSDEEPATDAATPGASATGETSGTVASTTASSPVETEPTPDPIFPGYETTEVRVLSPEGERLGAVNAAIADTRDLRYTGLSDTPSMPEDRGMLFVYDDVGEYTYVMRRMDFPLDMIFADGEGVVTVVHEAPAPGPNRDGDDIRRTGRARFVLEVNRGWSAERGAGEGDRLEFDLP